MIEIGSPAHDFELKDQNGNLLQMSQFKGKRVLLSFHPLAWTRVCAEQMKSLEANYELLGQLNCVALGMNVDSVPSKSAWAKTLSIERTRLLSDFWPHGATADAYGIFREKDGFSERANIIVDEQGMVVFAVTYPIGELPDIEKVIGLLSDSFPSRQNSG